MKKKKQTRAPSRTRLLFRALRGFGANVRTARKAANLTQAELSKRSGLDIMTISGLERGAMNPTMNVMLKLSCGLNVPLSALIPNI
jgi:transcriptional regulator with XRE-family HTH domain